ncbi:MAG: hypothetical protein D8M26_11050 [Ignavibacteriae bacterium]|nr:hypothetical protein [Ignavibacteriota bacterium]
MKEKLDTIESNLIKLIRKIEEIKCSEEVDYDAFWKLEKINKKIEEIEILLQELEELQGER